MTDATLASGVPMPRIGLGVFRAGSGDGTRTAVRSALDAGYRHIDTAAIYRNEAEVGEAIRRFCAHTGTPRDEIFVTTKLWNDDHGFDEALRAFDRSLSALGLEHIDQYLIHWPVPERRHASWRALEQLHAESRARTIGVSNFTMAHLEELLAHATIPPATNQVELHPWLPQPELVAWCRAHRIQTVAYSPLTKGRYLDHPVLTEVADRHGRTPAQVLIRWSLEQGHVVLPKSASPGRIRENLAVLDWALDEEAGQQLATLADATRTAWDPTDTP